MTLNFWFFLLIAGMVALGGCSSAKPPENQKPDFARGNQIFNGFCVECHLNPENEAPQLDEADDWDLRTHQWVAVLKDHVKSGFLGMPAQGGHPELSSQNISDALYFMEVKIRSLP
jgi:cytochrome c5